MDTVKQIICVLMADIKVRCSKCKHEFWMSEYKNVSCPKCGTVIKGPKA